ncbi:MAG TPA: glutamine-hydrolyzing GMP synthase [Candidatus Sulfotelmatobacter sp.]|jgi:GMP synthase (glutamine-hydrolysing)|nr:glutamine-hydrolyzing GMP synthase [Candidatus Sulfotelmatobacter sp.]
MILIVDFGSQTAHLIGRRLRQIGTTIAYVHPEEAIIEAKKLKPNGIILSGGPSSVYDKSAPTVSADIFTLGIPILGICYGWQLMAKLLGGNVKNTIKEYGEEKVTIEEPLGLFNNIPKKQFTIIVSHGDTVVTLPEGFSQTASTKTVEFTAVQNSAKHLYGVQFHPEAHHTEYGLHILENFTAICKEKYKPISLNPEKIIADIKNIVGNQKVICAVSGGVDSTVAAFLIAKAIGGNLIPVYVDSGLMRQHTDEHVKNIFSKHVRSNLVIIDARKRFIKKLKDITDSEQKRMIIGRLYVEIFQEVALKHPEAKFLGQGTIYSDVIESKGSKHASHIKSHHNVGGLPKDMHLKLLEPMRNFYKDEVREIGRLAGIPKEIVMQQPWPGPGHAVNIMGSVTEKRLAQVMQADQIVVEEMKKAGLYNKVFECFAIMTGAYSTAVKGDSRVYAEVVAIRSYDSVDIMTAEWSKIPYDILAKMSSRIVNEIADVSRVVYDITSKPPATMRWE